MVHCTGTYAAGQSNSEESWRSNLRTAIDLSTRRMESLRGSQGAWVHALGIDIHKVFSNDQGDYGTLVFQPYVVRLNNVPNPPSFFDDGDDWALNWRIANFNYTGLARGRFNLRIGHFEVPFGLEQNINTNGTLRQYSFSDRGIKVDWGVSVNGVLERLDYEIALTRGSGNDYRTRHDPYLFSGRVGTPATNNLILGFSWLYGDVLGRSDLTRRSRLGLDLALYHRGWELLFEVSGGENNHLATGNFLSELSWRTPMERTHLYTQLRQTYADADTGWRDGTRITLGAKYEFTPHISLSSELAHDVDALEPASRATGLTVQFRVRI